jgi:acetyl-CoA carboxylase biotin carboxylase subunit
MGEAAVKGAKAVGYKGAGTIEFLVDGERNFYFMEMNTRIQVEHPVTETVTGVDLVKCQIEVAAGLPLPFKQEDLRQTGHAIECRINAEDPSRGFAPCPGRIESLNVPGGVGVRVDSAVYQGYSIPPYYDSLIAKLIVYGADRAQAIARTKRALAEYLFEGVCTNTDFHISILSDPDFIEGKYDNNFLTEYLKRTQEKSEK